MNKVDAVVLALDGIKILPCWEVGSNRLCTRVLSDRIYKNVREYAGVYMNACTYHADTLGSGSDGVSWKEVLSS